MTTQQQQTEAEVIAVLDAIERLMQVIDLPPQPTDPADPDAFLRWLASALDICREEITALQRESLRNAHVKRTNAA